MPDRIGANKDRPPPWLAADLPETAYDQALDLQLRIVRAKTEGRLSEELLLVLEHPPVFTLGRRGGEEFLKVSRRFLERSGIPLVKAERGGFITYHGPGQLVAYPIVNLRHSGLGVAAFVSCLETVMAETAKAFGVHAGTNPRNRGVWVGEKKLGSIGITVRRGVTFHGLALNVNTDLTPFSWMNPCGLEGVGVTSLAEQCGRGLPMQEVRQTLISQVAAAFGVRMKQIDFSGMELWLASNESFEDQGPVEEKIENRFANSPQTASTISAGRNRIITAEEFGAIPKDKDNGEKR